MNSVMMPGSNNRALTPDGKAGYYSAYDLFIFVLTLISLSALAIIIVPGPQTVTKEVAYFLF